MSSMNTIVRLLTRGLKSTNNRPFSLKAIAAPPKENIELTKEVEEEEHNHPSSDEELSNSDTEQIEATTTVKKKKKSRAKMLAAASNQHTSEMNRLRKKHNIHIKGSDIPDPVTDFNELCSKYGLCEQLVGNLLEQGYREPTPVQMQAWPLLLSGREVLATAPTGSGKTAAFLLPIIHHLKRPRALGFRAVLVAPTKELAEQTYRDCIFLCQGTGLKTHIIDKVEKVISKFGPDTNQKFDILITTPNRLVYIIKSDTTLVNLNNVEWLIMDECDRLFEGGKRGFRDQLAVIYKACSGPKVQRSFFSATYSRGFELWCQENLSGLASLTVGQRNTASKAVEQELVFCGDESGKIYALRDIIKKGYKPPCLIFVQSKDRARQLFRELIYEDVMVDAIHGDRTQKQREDCVRAFRAKKIWVLICTELMARGIDFKGVNLVINYDFPPTLVSYIHRIGRTGRADQTGKAITFWTKDDQPLLGGIARNIRASGGSVPDWMVKMRRLAPQEKRATKSQKNRGFVSDGAKYTQVLMDKRKKSRVRKKLVQLKASDETDDGEVRKLQGKLRKLLVKKKEALIQEETIAEKEAVQIEKRKNNKKRKREQADGENNAKSQKKVKRKK